MEEHITPSDNAYLVETALRDIEGFPYERFIDQRVAYQESERWINGQALADQMDSGDSSKEIDLYPLRINPLPTTIQKHVAVLFGEPEDDGRTPVYTKMLIDSSDASKERAATAEDFLQYLWWENGGREAMLVNGMMSHIYGGCVFKATFTPWDTMRKYPIRIDTINPRNFVGFATGGDRFRLREGWYATEMSGSEAKLYGYDGEEEAVWYVEKWKPDKYQIWVDGKPARITVGGKSYPVGGENPFGFVPMVYIPHIRYSEFLGVPITANVKGMIKELNLRYGDYGDAVNEDAHSIVAVRNTVNAKPSRIGEHSVIDLGSKSAITSGEGEPDMFEVNNQKASSAMKDLLTAIWGQYRRDAFIPAVADGEDEGSQRSGLTLAIRFWPLTSHVKMERAFWTTGLDIFQGYLLRMAKMKVEGSKITDEHLHMQMKHIWAPMLPRDREIDVQEWVQRASADIVSIETLLEKSGDVDDIPEERQRILDWIKARTEMEEDAKAKAVQKYPPPNPFGGDGASPAPKGPPKKKEPSKEKPK